MQFPWFKSRCVNFRSFSNRELVIWRLEIKKKVFFWQLWALLTIRFSFLLLNCNVYYQVGPTINQKNQSPCLQLSGAKYRRIPTTEILMRTTDVAYQTHVQERTFQARKIKKTLRKNFLYFGKWSFLAPSLKNSYLFIFFQEGICNIRKTKISYISLKKFSPHFGMSADLAVK